MKEPFNPRRARGKRPCPIWNDAFQRDTQHLEADEVGAYIMILLAMWTRESCDFPDDDRRLARVSRVSMRLWKSRVGPALRPLFRTIDGALISKKLREVATYVEREVTQQHDRKTGENLAKSLETWDTGESADETADGPRNYPIQGSKDPIKDGGGVAHPREADEHHEVLFAAGIDPAKDVTGKWHGSAQLWEVDRWRNDLGLSQQEILATIRECKNGRGPPGSLAYFTPAMQRAAGRKVAPPLEPQETADAQPAKSPTLELIARAARRPRRTP